MSLWKLLFGDNAEEKARKAQELERRIQADKKGVRDRFRASRRFFQNQIEWIEERIENSRETLRKLKAEEGPEVDTSIVFYGFNLRMVELITASYSKGSPIPEIKEDCVALMETVSRIWVRDIDYTDGGDTNFHELTKSLCLGLLGEVPESYFQELSVVMQERGFSDFVIDYFTNAGYSKHPIGEKLLVDNNKSVNFLAKIIREEDKIEAAKKLHIYLDNYYYTKGNLAYEYGMHTFDDGRCFYGYWCWEAAALVKIKGLDDTAFRKHKYYPADFLHQVETPIKKHTFLADE